MRWLGSITESIDMNLSQFWETVADRVFWSAADHGVAKKSDMTKLLNNKNKVWDYAADVMPSHSSQIQKIQPGSHAIMYFPLYICT